METTAKPLKDPGVFNYEGTMWEAFWHWQRAVSGNFLHAVHHGSLYHYGKSCWRQQYL